MHIGKEVKERRLKLRMTQKELAKEANVTIPTLINIEKCNDNYIFDKLIDIFTALEREVVVSTKRIR